MAFRDESPSLKFWQILTKVFPKLLHRWDIQKAGSSLRKQEAALLNFLSAPVFRAFCGVYPAYASNKPPSYKSYACVPPAIPPAYDCCQAGLPEYKMNGWNHYFCNSCMLEMRQWQSGRIPSPLAAEAKVTVSAQILTISLTHLQAKAINRQRASVPGRSANLIAEQWRGLLTGAANNSYSKSHRRCITQHQHQS